MAEEIDQLRSTVSASAIKRVAIVDDVFDTPAISSIEMGEVLTFLQNGENLRAGARIEKDVWERAIAEITASEHDSENVAAAVERLYEIYVDTGDSQYDLAGVFSRTRAANLNYVRPLLALLGSCESLVLSKFGSLAPDISDEEMPDLVLVDLFMNPAIAPVEELDSGQAHAAVETSLGRVRPLLKNNPSVILMSSHGERGQLEAKAYRAKLDDRVYASRFGFVDKGQIKIHPEHGLSVEEAARDTLLDVFQNYKFGKALSEAMTRWLAGTKKAVDDIGRDIRNLQLNEISYLVQFRLSAEGQGLEEYLEWFFGEALLDYIIRAIDEAHAEKPLEQSLDAAAVATIDGGIEPTKNVARMYHRVRVESKRSRSRKNFRLGDIYRERTSKRIVAVMTPDCDLVLRKNGTKEVRNAEHLLLVPGLISDLETASASVGDFLMIGEVPHNIQWVYKKVFSSPFTGTLAKAGQSGDDFEYIGALRPLYAQEIQANLLSHIGRVGVAVAPVIGMPAVSTIVVRTTSGLKEISAQGTTFNCSVIHARASTQQPRVLFDREVIRKIKAALLNMPADDLVEVSSQYIEALRLGSADSIENALKKGPEIGTELSNGIMLRTGKRDGTNSGPWCAIYVSQVKVHSNAEDQATKKASALPPSEIPRAPATPAVGLVDPEVPVAAQTADLSVPTLVGTTLPEP